MRLLSLCLTVFCLSASLCGAEAVPDGSAALRRYRFPVMGTEAVLLMDAPPDRADRAAEAVKEAFDRVLRAANPYDPESELSRLNASAARQPFACSDDLWNMLDAARTAYRLSGGSFDITARPLMDLWGFYRSGGIPKLPSPEERKRALEKVGLEKVIFDDQAHTVFFSVPGMAFDLGGLAKGYAVDLACEAIRSRSIRCALVNLGGNIGLLEPPPGEKGWKIRILDPERPGHTHPRTFLLKNTAVSTSGDYERNVGIDGKRYGHILDPRTGLPVRRDFSVTVIAPSAQTADFLSTVYFLRPDTVLPENEGNGVRVMFHPFSSCGDPR